MIRLYQAKDHDKVMEIWLLANLQIHDFISKKYWQENYTEVSRILRIATALVCEESGHIRGFLVAMESMIVGLFVADGARRNGVGKELLDSLKVCQQELTVSVYEKNPGAIRFFMREGFEVQSEQTNQGTGEEEMLLVWKNRNSWK